MAVRGIFPKSCLTVCLPAYNPANPPPLLSLCTTQSLALQKLVHAHFSRVTSLSSPTPKLMSAHTNPCMYTHIYTPTHIHGLLSNQTKPCLFMSPKLLLSLGLGSRYCLCLEYSLFLLQRADFYQISA